MTAVTVVTVVRKSSEQKSNLTHLTTDVMFSGQPFAILRCFMEMLRDFFERLCDFVCEEVA